MRHLLALALVGVPGGRALAGLPADTEQKLMAEYARKYADAWRRFVEDFRNGFKSGDRVLVRYTPAP